ncbi:MAG: hypothetical protein OEV74_09480 [Cyclobacteriaceae bacterium]|nr:hypothetical protein [Cyclobacteriaceae bacterium]MDH4296499.1 hypothetical protein [Cyclobacteriaceae bacterium]MDH5249270.1 hypothetical protein [Cyclobacteriaceae bacterium]
MFKAEIVEKTWLLFIIGLMVACNANKAHHEDQIKQNAIADEEWIAMDNFHLLMAECFHPFRDSADVEPAKRNAIAIASAAAEWLASPLPHKVDSDEIKSKLQQLNRDAASLVDNARNGDDAAIGKSLTAIHSVFHEIQEAWYSGHEDEKGDH